METRKKIYELKERKITLSNEKREAEGELSDMRDEVRLGGRLPRDEYAELVARQREVKAKSRRLDARLSRINLEIQRLSDEEFASGLKAEIASLKEEVDRLRAWKVHVEAGGCYVARPGEQTYECRSGFLCPACKARGLEDMIVDSFDESEER